MNTTVQLSYETKEILDRLKYSLHSDTYDEVIKKLIVLKTNSMAGKLSKNKKYTREEILEGLRDEQNRV